MRKIAALLGCLLLVGCANDLQGEVVEKDYSAAYFYYVPITMSCGPNCTTTQLQQYYVPECHLIKVAGEESGTTCISVGEWNEVEVGDYYEGPDVDPKDRKRESDG